LTTLNELAKSKRQEAWSLEKWKKLYRADQDHKEFKQFFVDQVDQSRVQDFIQVAHTIGNFLPWPAGCNSPRGIGPVKDYWDLTLDCIYWWYQKNRAWLKAGNTFQKNDTIVNLFGSQMVNFTQFLAAFGSWDVFVEDNYMRPCVEEPGVGDEKYGRPKELWKGHLAKATPVLPQTEEEIETFFKRAAECVRERGKLMVTALRKKEEAS